MGSYRNFTVIEATFMCSFDVTIVSVFQRDLLVRPSFLAGCRSSLGAAWLWLFFSQKCSLPTCSSAFPVSFQISASHHSQTISSQTATATMNSPTPHFGPTMDLKHTDHMFVLIKFGLLSVDWFHSKTFQLIYFPYVFSSTRIGTMEFSLLVAAFATKRGQCTFTGRFSHVQSVPQDSPLSFGWTPSIRCEYDVQVLKATAKNAFFFHVCFVRLINNTPTLVITYTFHAVVWNPWLSFLISGIFCFFRFWFVCLLMRAQCFILVLDFDNNCAFGFIFQYIQNSHHQLRRYFHLRFDFHKMLFHAGGPYLISEFFYNNF